MSLTGKNKLKLLVHFLSPDMTSSFCMSDVVWRPCGQTSKGSSHFSSSLVENRFTPEGIVWRPLPQTSIEVSTRDLRWAWRTRSHPAFPLETIKAANRFQLLETGICMRVNVIHNVSAESWFTTRTGEIKSIWFKWLFKLDDKMCLKLISTSPDLHLSHV